MAHVSAGNYDLVRSVREAAFRSSAACRTCQSWSFSEWLIASRTFGPEKVFENPLRFQIRIDDFR